MSTPKANRSQQTSAEIELENLGKCRAELQEATRIIKDVKFFIDGLRGSSPKITKLYSEFVNEYMKDLSITQRGFGETKTLLNKLVQAANDKTYKAAQLLIKSSQETPAPTLVTTLSSNGLMDIGGKMFTNVDGNWILLDSVTVAYSKSTPTLAVPATTNLEEGVVEAQVSAPPVREQDHDTTVYEEYLNSLLVMPKEFIYTLSTDTQAAFKLFKLNVLQKQMDDINSDAVVIDNVAVKPNPIVLDTKVSDQSL